MAALSYQRVDHVVTVTLEPPRRSGGSARVVITGPIGETWSTRTRPGEALRLGGLVRMLDALPLPTAAWPSIERVVLHVPQALAGEPWEQALAKWAGYRVIVRTSQVPPPYAGRPLALPLRIAEATLPGMPRLRGPEPESLAGVIERITRTARREHAVVAVETITRAASRLEAELRKHSWPTLDALQLDGRLPETALIDPRPDGPPGSLGWLERLAGLYQLRLLVLPVEQTQLADARSLAARLVERGGPAVVLAPGTATPAWAAARWLCVGLVHDEPLDLAVQSLAQAELYAGAGREDALRVSAGLEQVVADRVEAPTADEAVARSTTGRARLTLPERRRLVRGVDALAAKWPDLDFSGEGRGLYPSVKVSGPLVDTMGRGLSMLRREPTGRAAREPRFVNATLYERGADGRPGDEVSLDGPALVTHGGYVLSVEIGRLVERVQAAGALELLVEDQLWDEDEGGLWLELGVAGVGCTVLGAPVQPLWLPRFGPSEPRQFLVAMGDPGIAVLRYTLYHHTHVVQSFRLAAVVAGRRGARVTAAGRRKLAAALGLGPADIGERTWQARLDFSTIAHFEQAAVLTERTLALVVNDVAGTPMVTVKGRGDLQVTIPTDLDGDVRGARKVMNEVSGADRNAYRFGYMDDPNATNDDFFSDVLGKLAQVGWSLRSRILAAGYDAENEAKLAEPGGVIQVAHVVRDKVVPWALVYDKPYDAGRRKLMGRPVEHVACTAALPAADGKLRVTTCGTDPACQLHPDRLAERDAQGLPAVARETVACPLGFWGVRHEIELPPRQVRPGEALRPAALTIGAGASARVLLAFNARLVSTADHEKGLLAALAKARRGGLPAYAVSDRDDVVDALADPELDIAYLYCHALGGEPDGPVPPRLEFQDPEPALTPPVAITPAELPQVTWAHNPLVVLNGCGTTGFSSNGTSQFIAELVDRREAAAVVGADVPVAEVLAAEVGTVIVGAVADGLPLGEALQRVRHDLLARRNPLGLVYTLYGSVDLRLKDA